MLLFPELNNCIFDSTAPHEYYPSRDGDSIIDMYTELIIEGTDERYENELTDIVKRYKAFNKERTAHLAKAKQYQDELIKIYSNATDDNMVDTTYNELLQKVLIRIK